MKGSNTYVLLENSYLQSSFRLQFSISKILVANCVSCISVKSATHFHLYGYICAHITYLEHKLSTYVMADHFQLTQKIGMIRIMY